MRNLIYFIIIGIYITSAAFIASANTVDDEKEIKDLFSNYVSLIEAASGKNYPKYITEIDPCFEDPLINNHIADVFKDPNNFDFAQSYVRRIQDIKSIKRVEIDQLNLEILNCSYFDETVGNNYKYLKFNKLIYTTDENNAKTVQEYLKINITTKPYKIELVFDEKNIEETAKISKCLNTVQNDIFQQQKAEQINKLKEETRNLYERQNYVLAYVENQKVLGINPSDEEAQNYKEAIENFITEESLNKYFQPEIDADRINSAKNILEILVASSTLKQNLLNEWKNKIALAEKKQKQQLDFEKAEYFFNEEMYQQALPIYLKLQNEGFTIPSLTGRIEACKDADPELIQKRIQKAYDAAVASKKNYHETFKTYYKYENSGYLKGTNFHFMSLMMIDRGNKKLLRDMGLSQNQAKNLAIKYFYKARNMGFNNKDIEVIVFTKNFDKNKN